MVNRREPAHKIPTAKLLAYGALGLPLAALNLPLFVYLPTFYAGELGISLAYVGTILLIARLLDVASDPLIGFWSDHTSSRLGRRLPWLLGSAPVLLISTYMLFVPPQDAGAVHLALWSALAYLGWTAMLLSYTSIGAELSGDYNERTRLTTAREGCVVFGITVAASLPVLIGEEPGSREVLQTIFVGMAIALPVLLFVLVRSLPNDRMSVQNSLGFIQGLRIAFKNRPFRQLITAYFLNGIANGLPATLFLFFAEYRLGAPQNAGLFLILYFGAGILAVPVWLKLSFRFGKHRCWAASMAWASLMFAGVLFLGEGDIVAFSIICVLSGFSLGADLAIPASMQADVVDLDTVQSGEERTGLFFGLWGMATKLALALSVGIAFPTLAMIGFETNAVNTEGALWGLALLYGGLPVLIKIGSIAFIWRFELDQTLQCKLRAKIESGR